MSTGFNRTDALVITSLLFLILLINRLALSTRGHRLPPGPSRIPFLGNLHQVPLVDQQKTFAEWMQKYGDVIYIELFSKPFLIVSSVQAAQDLMEKRASKYSDRPYFLLLREFVMTKPLMIFMSYDNRYRRLRRWYQGSLENKAVLEGYRPVQTREIGRLLSSLMETSEDFISHIKRFNGAVMLDIAYGHRVTSVDDEFMIFADKTIATITALGSFAATLVDFFPIMKYLPSWMPGSGFKKQAVRGKEMWDAMEDIPYQKLRNAMESDSVKRSFTTFMLDEVSHDGKLTEDDEIDVKGSATLMYAAGVDTSMTSLSTLMLAMTIYPEVARKAQAEIDQVVGLSRLPDLSDRDVLPYVESIVKEVYRWNPPAPLGVPHCVRDDDNYRGYDIPGGSMIVPNVWAMSRDSALYPDPEAFRPERFEGLDANATSLLDPRKYVFGFGRRICPGRYLADSSVWLVTASILATMNVGRARDAAGHEIVPAPSFKNGIISHVDPFVCTILPRSERAVRLIEELVAHSAENPIV
ncbi:hypothetical protein POSPLADRAFT_1053131 [Postia placenta MAD-698-R-SB12]|uniref:Cytochrome P450 n=1 Tax=Postia placenta MAD-698-R-SB12 TaxID=670580 RepID=A0A1X6ND41_9APHY|nr:hypothetical protein POSPLADRAFT_1053131 [Postia placenta MAD-698-R-SB12]OSX66494.1 hypothetical protein POSPLADRAFT_1053131 [Postia placenta MAD-698-R-SB12]